MFLAVFSHHQVYFTRTYMENNCRGGDIDIVDSIVPTFTRRNIL